MSLENDDDATVVCAAVLRLQRLRGELADLAFQLEAHRRLDAADVVNAIASRVAEIEGETTSTEEKGAR